MLGAQRIAVYGRDDQQSLRSRALTQGEPVTAETERGGGGAAAAQAAGLREESCSLVPAAKRGGSRDCRAHQPASPRRGRHAGLFIGPLRMGQLQFLSRGSHLTSLLRCCSRQQCIHQRSVAFTFISSLNVW